jgi:hypothetical protein
MNDSGNGTYTAHYATGRSADLVIIAISALAVSLISVGLRFQLKRHEAWNAFALYKDDVLCFAAVVRSRRNLLTSH